MSSDSGASGLHRWVHVGGLASCHDIDCFASVPPLDFLSSPDRVSRRRIHRRRGSSIVAVWAEWLASDTIGVRRNVQSPREQQRFDGLCLRVGRFLHHNQIPSYRHADPRRVLVHCMASASLEFCDPDGDGYAGTQCDGTDCDDANPLIHPGATEVCTDGVDNDCNGLTDAADLQCS
jgi:Putative metal-binding motif